MFTDTEGRIEYVNPYFCELTGYSVEEVVGHNPNILSSGMQPKHFYREMWQTIQAGQVWEGEFCNRRKDGTQYWESAVIAPITNAQGEIVKYVAAKHNITRLKEYEQAMEQALHEAEAGLEAKAAFLSIISHELRTPLNHILGPCELVADDLPAGASRALLENAIQAGHHLTDLVQRIIRFSELGIPSERQLRLIADPEAWLNSALQPYAGLAKKKGATLRAAVNKDFPEIFTADEAALSEILTILVDNALEYSTPGTIRVELSAELPNARLAVIDPGPVLSQAGKKRLFQLFQQLDMSHTREHPGIGLGLCLARRYADRCGGSIEVNEDPGGGNRFEFVFPITIAREEHPTPATIHNGSGVSDRIRQA